MSEVDNNLIIPDWSVPDTVRACITTRSGGFSKPPWDSLNLALHVGDDPDPVQHNRQRLFELAALPAAPLWLEQVHGNRVIDARDWSAGRRADACYSAASGQVCGVLTADCLPVLMASQNGDEVAAVHAGWRGLASGILAAAIARFRAPSHHLNVWLGPAISAGRYEVDSTVLRHFSESALAEAARPVRPGHALLDLVALARWQLQAAGVEAIGGGQYCTFSDSKRFFSHRRQSVCGRMASLIWLQTP